MFHYMGFLLYRVCFDSINQFYKSDMNLNYTAFLLISFLPLLIALVWYHPNSPVTRWSGIQFAQPLKMSFPKLVAIFLLSIGLVYGYMNLIIHQLGFYELFFTDIMLGNEEAKQITTDFLNKYGRKHRHFGHGVLHGLLNAFLFALPFVGIHALLEDKNWKYVGHHFSYWLVMSMVIGGLISEFV